MALPYQTVKAKILSSLNLFTASVYYVHECHHAAKAREMHILMIINVMLKISQLGYRTDGGLTLHLGSIFDM